MIPITQRSAAILQKLIEGLNEENRSRKICNSNTFMPVTIEFIQSNQDGDLFSVCHYYEQNGDLMRDPEVVFLRREVHQDELKKNVTFFFPTIFQQDNLGIYQQLVRFDENGKINGLAVRPQNDCAKFCNQWMRNIKQQQGL